MKPMCRRCYIVTLLPAGIIVPRGRNRAGDSSSRLKSEYSAVWKVCMWGLAVCLPETPAGHTGGHAPVYVDRCAITYTDQTRTTQQKRKLEARNRSTQAS